MWAVLVPLLGLLLSGCQDPHRLSRTTREWLLCPGVLGRGELSSFSRKKLRSFKAEAYDRRSSLLRSEDIFYPEDSCILMLLVTRADAEYLRTPYTGVAKINGRSLRSRRHFQGCSVLKDCQYGVES